MVLQTLFVLSSLVPAASAPLPTSTITIHGSRMFTAHIIPARGARSFDARYPGAVVIATEDTRDRAYLVANRLSEIGVTAMMYVQEEFATTRLQVSDAMAAVDSMRRRIDVRPEEVGVVAFEQATNVVPELVRDTTLGFAIAASLEQPMSELSQRYAKSHAATLLVQGVRKLDKSDVPLSNVTQTTPGSRDPTIVVPAGEAQRMSPNVTLWAVAKEQLDAIGEAKSPLGARVVNWVKEQVHAIPIVQQQPTVNIH